MTAYTLLLPVVMALTFIGYVACVMRARWITLALTLGLAAGVWQITPPGSDTAFQWLGAGIAVLAAFWVAHMPWVQPPAKPKASKSKTGQQQVVVDGTNVIYWNGDPDLDSLRIVVAALRKRGLTPMVFLDASTRHHLKQPDLDAGGFAKALGIKPPQITICPAGTEADAFIVKYAKTHRLPIVSNDRFGDRAQQVKGIKRINGVIAGGKVIFEGF